VEKVKQSLFRRGRIDLSQKERKGTESSHSSWFVSRGGKRIKTRTEVRGYLANLTPTVEKKCRK